MTTRGKTKPKRSEVKKTPLVGTKRRHVTLAESHDIHVTSRFLLVIELTDDGGGWCAVNCGSALQG